MSQTTALSGKARARRLTLYRYRLPLRRRFGHASAVRDTNQGILVRLELSDGSVGLGEGVPRPYVTGESINSAIEAVQKIYVPRLASDDPLANGPAAGSAWGVWHNAAWCACELAWLDAQSRSAGLPLAEHLGRALGRPVSRAITPRVAGVIGAEDSRNVSRSLLVMQLIGLRDFKLKVGLPTDRQNLALCSRRLGRGLARGKVTLRVDANGVWSLEEALRACRWMKDHHVAALEQPLRKGDEADLPELRRQGGLPIMLDESLIDLVGARALAEAGAADYWNLRIAKNGGLLQSLRLADLAREHGVGLMLGALVGESGILSAAARVFLQLVPEVRFVENSYGSFLLAEDLVRERTRFGYGGRLRPLRGPGLGVTLKEVALERLAKEVACIDLS